MSKHHVTIKCPACKQPLDATVDMVEETEGDCTIPYGTHTYLALDDYNVDWQAHHAALLATDDSDGSVTSRVRVSGCTCESIVKTPTTQFRAGWPYVIEHNPIQEKFEELLADAGARVYYDAESDHYDSLADSARDAMLEAIYGD